MNYEISMSNGNWHKIFKYFDVIKEEYVSIISDYIPKNILSDKEINLYLYSLFVVEGNNIIISNNRFLKYKIINETLVYISIGFIDKGIYKTIIERELNEI